VSGTLVNHEVNFEPQRGQSCSEVSHLNLNLNSRIRTCFGDAVLGIRCSY
jgi:hypothetical protein